MLLSRACNRRHEVGIFAGSVNFQREGKPEVELQHYFLWSNMPLKMICPS